MDSTELQQKMTLKLQGRRLFELSGAKNIHQLSLLCQLSYPTVDKYINKPGDIKMIDLDVLGNLLSGLGITIDQARGMQLSDIFQID